MAQPSEKKRPLSFYVTILLAIDVTLVALVILTGGIDVKLGPLRLQVQDLHYPAIILLGLLFLRRALLAGGREGKDKARWQDAFFGPAGSPTERWRAVEVLLAITAAYTLFVGNAAVARHRAFGSDAMSLGVAAQAAWNTVHGGWLATSLLEGGNYLGRHFSPAMAFIAQGYRFWESPELLIRLQTLFLAFGAWPVYLIAREKLEDRRWATALAILYLAHPAVRGMNLSGFHPVSFGLAPLILAFYLLDSRRRWGGYVFLAFALLCGEQLWITTAFFGLYLCVAKRRWREGLFLFLLTFYGYIFLLSFVMPKLGGVKGSFMGLYSHLGGGVKDILVALVSHPSQVKELLRDPGRIAYLKELFMPLAFLPLLGPAALLFGLPLLALNLLANDLSCYSVRSAHVVTVLPFLFLAAPSGLRFLKTGKGTQHLKLLSGPFVRWACLVLPLMAFGVSPAIHFSDDLPGGYREGFIKAASRIPVDAPLSAQDRLVPHLAHRRELQIFPETEGSAMVLAGVPGEEPEMPRGEFRDTLLELLTEHRYGVLYRDDFFLLLSENEGDRSPMMIKDIKSTL
ncbi:DUF2079 domain-containing protein [bacterium]|nr:DUF2079 domain-containing protein [bacterium]